MAAVWCPRGLIYLLEVQTRQEAVEKIIFCRQWHIESWKYPRRTKRPQRSGGTVICTRVPLIIPWRRSKGNQGTRSQSASMYTAVSETANVSDLTILVYGKQGAARWVSLKYYRHISTINSVLLACIFHFGVKTLSACRIHTASILSVRPRIWNEMWMRSAE